MSRKALLLVTLAWNGCKVHLAFMVWWLYSQNETILEAGSISVVCVSHHTVGLNHCLHPYFSILVCMFASICSPAFISFSLCSHRSLDHTFLLCMLLIRFVQTKCTACHPSQRESPPRRQEWASWDILYIPNNSGPLSQPRANSPANASNLLSH